MKKIILFMCLFLLCSWVLSMEIPPVVKKRLTACCQVVRRYPKDVSKQIRKKNGIIVSISQMKNKTWRSTDHIDPYKIERKIYTDSFIVYLSTTLYSKIKKEHPNSQLKHTDDRTISFKNLYYLSNQKDSIFDMTKVGTETQGKYIISTSDGGKHIDYGRLLFLSNDSLAYYNYVSKDAIGGIQDVLQYKIENK